MTDIVNIEEYAKQGKNPEKGKRYQFRVDKTNVITDQECLIGREILVEAGLDPDKFLLRQIVTGNKKEPVGLDETVCFTTPGIERFVTIPKDPKDGCHA